GEAVVVGDIVLLEAGDKVPADMRLLKVHGLQIQEALLTGESLPVDKQTAPVEADAGLGDQLCMAFSGTTVTAGTAQGVVIATGEATQIGRISGLLASVESLTTPLVEQMDVFAKYLTFFILGVSALVLGYELYATTTPFDELFMAIVGLAVAAIPEGLPAVLTITLAIGVQAMARRNAIVRRLPAIETIGAVSVICTDKTGTLTRNEMMVTTLVLDGGVATVTGQGYEPIGDVTQGDVRMESTHPVLQRIARVCALCNDAQLRNHDGDYSVEGDPMEGALMAFALKVQSDLDAINSEYVRTDAIPFDAKYQYMATLNHTHDGNAYIFVKGAIERLLPLCKQSMNAQGESIACDHAWWESQAHAIAREGKRVLAVAYKSIATSHTILTHDDLKEELVLLGLVALIDPPRAEAVEAVAQCHAAGIAVKMITGDHALTAASIGKQIGLKQCENVLIGTQIDALNDTQLAQAVMESDVFARTTPEHKLRLVMALQSHEMIVAMTGDGVNDAPALKRADAGIAMGQKGSEAAKEAAQLVLADDNFASIVAAVSEGRTIYANIKKVISWTLPTSTGEAAVIMLALLLGMMLPVTPVQILWINMITAVTLGIALAFEPADAHTMRRHPRKRNEPILSGVLLWQVLFTGALFVVTVFGLYNWAIQNTESIEYARTMAMNTLIFLEMVYLFYVRNMSHGTFNPRMLLGTKPIWIAVGIVTVAQAIVTYVPWVQTVFATQALSLIDVALIGATGAALFVIVELEKIVRMRLWGR
ncbi:MAG: carbonate dehydratase, partial [Sulfuricurvum sp. PC08-66]